MYFAILCWLSQPLYRPEIVSCFEIFCYHKTGVHRPTMFLI
jgi:hypothetical protein